MPGSELAAELDPVPRPLNDRPIGIKAAVHYGNLERFVIG
jgi:hypothetical protein